MVVLLACVAAQQAQDPLAQWLDDLKFNLQDVTQEKAGITFHVTDLVCQNLELTGIQSAVQGVGLSVTLGGLGIQCSGRFTYHGYAILSGSGGLNAVVSSTPSSSATVVLEGSGFEKSLPWTVDVGSCSASLDFKLTLSGSIVDYIVNLFSGPISALIERQAVQQACEKLKQLASGPLSRKLAAFNRLMLPPGFRGAESSAEPPSTGNVDCLQLTVNGFAAQMLAESAKPAVAESAMRASWAQRRLSEKVEGTVDWQKDKLLHWLSWLLDDVLGPERLDEALRWAWKGQEMTIPGPAQALLTSTIQQPDAGLKLKLEVFLVQAVVDGADGMSSFSPVQAAGPEDLSFEVAWGAALGLGVEVKVNMEAIDLATGQSQGSVVQEMSLHLGLMQPSLGITAQALVLADQWPGRHTLAQLLLEPRACLTSIFQSAPQVQTLEAKFSTLAAPLSFEAKTTGALEASISSLLNHVVVLFNQVYEPLLPGAIQRAAGSKLLLSKLNDALKAQMKPGGCIDPSMASQKIRSQVPQNYSNWPPLFDTAFRSRLNNFIDGFLAQNTSVLDQCFSDVPSLRLPLDAEFTIKQLSAEGTDQVSNLRVLIPETQPSLLGMSVAVKCPAPAAAWRPSLGINGSLLAGGFQGSGLASVVVPCGAAGAEIEVVLDLWSLLDLQLPSSPACLLASTFAKLDVKEINATWDGGGDFQVTANNGLPQEPFKELCEMHPQVCRLAVKFRQYLAGRLGTAGVFQHLRDSMLKHCTQTDSTLQAQRGVDRDSGGYWYVPASSLWLWMISGLAVLALSLTYGFCAQFGELRHPDSCVDSGRAPVPLASVCWFGVQSWPGLPCSGKSGTVAVSILMSAGLVSRILACFCLPVASSGIEIMHDSSSIFKDETLLLFTFFGTGVQFGLGGSLYCEFLWFFMSLVASLVCHAILVLVWMTPFLAKHRRQLLLVAVVLGRFPLSEIETTSNTILILSNRVSLPLGLSQALGLSLQAGAYVSWFSSISTLLAILMLLALLPREVKARDWAAGKAPVKVMALQGMAAAIMTAGICVWWFCDYLYAETGGIAGALIDPASYSASQLGASDKALRTIIVLLAVVCPLCHVVAFCLGLSGKAPAAARKIAGLAATFCLLDLFTIGYLISFIEGVGGFASSSIHGLAPNICDLSQESLDEDCLTIRTRVLPLGTAGLVVATAAWASMCSFQVLGAGQDLPREEDPRAVTA